MRWFVRGDLDGFFGLALDNLVQLLLVAGLCTTVLGFPAALVYDHVLPGAAVSLVVGNLFYAWQARQLAAATGRADVCALPYGINTVSLVAHVFLIMLPAKIAAKAAGLPDDEAARVAWRAGLMATLASGVFEFAAAWVAEPFRKATPRAALLSTLAGVALGFISLGFLLRTFAHPVVGLTTLGIVLLVYFGRVRFVGGLPGGVVAVAVGTALAWATGLGGSDPPAGGLSPHPPRWAGAELVESWAAGHLGAYLTVIIPMAVFNVIGSLQNIESAEAAGDAYDTASSLAVNGLGSVAAALFGSAFPTTIYIGHPGWKAMGARAGYSVLNAAFFTAACLTGALGYIAYAVPIDAGMAIVLWIGIVITAQAFSATPREHAPAVAVGLLPGVAAWGVYLTKTGLRAAGYGSADKPFTDVQQLVGVFERNDFWLTGAFALEQGFIFTSIILSAATVALIERQFRTAGAWCLLAAVFSAVGLMHAYRWTPGDTVLSLPLLDALGRGVAGDSAGMWDRLRQTNWSWAVGYAVMAAVFFAAPWVTVPHDGGRH